MSQTMTLEEYHQYVEQTNEAFRTASRERRRVMLAEDVLKQVEMRRLVAKSTYLSFQGCEGSYEEISRHPDRDYDLRELLRDKDVCEVCGIGALFLAAVERVDDIGLKTYIQKYRNGIVHYMRDRHNLFDDLELEYIEHIFEHYAFGSKQLKLRRLMEMIVGAEGRPLMDRDFETVKNVIKADSGTAQERQQY